MATRVWIIAAVVVAGLVVGCTSDTTATPTDQFEGEFFVTGVGAQSPAGEFPYGDAIMPRFDGAGTATWTGTGPEFESFSYTGKVGGTITFGQGSGYLTPDGQVMIASDPQPNLWAGIRVSPLMDWKLFEGDYAAFMIGGHETGPCWVRTLDIHSTGKNTLEWSITDGGAGQGIYAYSLLNGVLAVEGNFLVDVSRDDTIGAVTSTGSVFFLAEIEGQESAMMVGIRRSQGNTAALLNGRYRIRGFSAAEPRTGSVSCLSASATVQADGAGHYSYSWKSSDGTKEAGSGIYSIADDGTLYLIDLGITGIVSEDGNTLALSQISDDEVMLAVGVRD